ncbi:MAG: hypothetical protein L0211_17730 [Planctomycetaceae bacterium]|nr:hypothetical protein [Planctomycetaceae bacterium]
MSQAATNSERPPPANRLTIAHLLLWTATTALVIGAIMPDPFNAHFDADTPARVRSDLTRQQQKWRIVTVVTGPVLGAGLAGLAIAAWRYCRRQPGFPTQPGHWNLMIIGTSTLAIMELHLFNRLEPVPATHMPLLHIIWATFFLSLFLVVVAYVHTQEPLHWKRVFGIAATSIGLFFMGGCCAFPLGPRPILLILSAILYAIPISMAVATAIDIRTGHRYDVFHWVGIIAVPALAVIITGFELLR